MFFSKSFIAIIIAANLLAGCASNSPKPSTILPPEELSLSEEMLLVRNKAGSSDLDAMFELGAYYASALENTNDDSPHAIYWLKLAASNGHVWAQNEMGVAYRDSRYGLITDFVKAFAWFKQAADKGESMAQFNIARLYRDGIGTDRDLQKSLQYMELSASQSYLDAIYSTALAYQQGNGSVANPTKYNHYRNQSLMHGYNKYNFFMCEYNFFSNDKISNTVIERMFLYYHESAIDVDNFEAAVLNFVSNILYSDDFKSRVENFLNIDMILNPQVYQYNEAETTRIAFIKKIASSLSIYKLTEKEKIEYEMVRVASLLGNRSAQVQLSNIYATGRGIKKSLSEAKYWAEKARSNASE